jgi:hypothetical protein
VLVDVNEETVPTRNCIILALTGLSPLQA